MEMQKNLQKGNSLDDEKSTKTGMFEGGIASLVDISKMWWIYEGKW